MISKQPNNTKFSYIYIYIRLGLNVFKNYSCNNTYLSIKYKLIF